MAKTIKNIFRDEINKQLILQILSPEDSTTQESIDSNFSPEEGFSECNQDVEVSLQNDIFTELENSIEYNDSQSKCIEKPKFHPIPEEFAGYKVIHEERICDLLSVVSVVRRIPKKKADNDVELMRENLYETDIFTIPLSVLGDTKKFSEVLAKNFIFLKQSNIYPVTDYLRAAIDYAQQKRQFRYEHTPLGFYEYDGKTLFFWEETQIDANHTSKCVRPFGKFKLGTEQEYDDMLEKYVFPDTQLSLAYTLGFTSPLAAKLYEYTDLGIPLVSFNGKSSTGKTLSCMLAISSFANPNLQSGSLMVKTDSSANGLSGQLSNSDGLIFCLDDVDTDTARDMSTVLYRLSNGTSRTVSDTKGNAIQRGSWRGTILLNSETSLAENIHKGGINARLIEFKDVLWTKSATIANSLRKAMTKSYGHKGAPFGQYVAELDMDTLLSEFEECKLEVANMIKGKDSLSDRIDSKYALILLTIRHVNSFFKINLDEKNIMEFVLKNEEKNFRDRDKALASYTYLFEYYLENPNCFNIKKMSELKRLAKSKCCGEAIYYPTKIYLCIRSNQMKDIMIKGGFSQFKSYKDEWKRRGYIIHDDGRSDTSNKILGRHYKFVYNKTDIDSPVGDNA